MAAAATGDPEVRVTTKTIETIEIGSQEVIEITNGKLTGLSVRRISYYFNLDHYKLSDLRKLQTSKGRITFLSSDGDWIQFELQLTRSGVYEFRCYMDEPPHDKWKTSLSATASSILYDCIEKHIKERASMVKNEEV